MRVLLTHELYPPDVAGGGEHVVQHTAEGLLSAGVDVRVLTTGDPAIAQYGPVATKRLPIHKYRFNLEVARIMEEARDADVIQTFTYHAALPSLVAAKRLQKPVVLVCLGLFGDAWLQMRGPIAGRCWREWERYLITRTFDRVVFLSGYSRDAGVRMGVDSTRSSVDWPGVEANEFNARTPKENVVLFVGKLDVRKGLDMFFSVADALPDIPFRVVGWGPKEQEYRAAAPSNVEIRKWPEPGGLWREFERASMFFLPSRAETFGMAILQAMAGGCAVVSTVPLPYEGAQVRIDELDGMVDAVRRLWSDRAGTLAAGQRNAALAQTFTWQRFCSHLMDLYCELSNGAPLALAAHAGELR